MVKETITYKGNKYGLALISKHKSTIILHSKNYGELGEDYLIKSVTRYNSKWYAAYVKL